ncbi:FAD/NAD(P)-binding domain-containing protein [Schizophyllum commune H4-8]|uniref:Glucose-methanol-choline oxidoreductase C-terminal domain-containing protein n=1 Tax=Schizophyllum commune (strain H4-8 / FGSC 9210) TaxID=578458 RepID=D8PSV7_SCHCM|nr:FAD/NAD(P)-binding domain-containing protein [Schizophyllum commune H4-8]KAI5899539.1 FAD/NAD(P)-binding domain-containing protein [Schizophyllum commune H4-8]
MNGFVDANLGLEDYLKVPEPSQPSFHYRTGKIPILPSSIAPKDATNQWGYPRPSAQSPTPAHATAKHYFVDDTTWANIVDHGEFDDIVVGSGFCALAYVDAALKLDSNRKILILERGGFWLPEHFQNMPLPFKLMLGGPSETFPWQLTSKTVESPAKFMHGSCPFFGGRSMFWSAWCPRPLREDKGIDLMREFPKSLKDTASAPGFWERCEDLLHVKRANEISDPCFGQDLQAEIQRRLDANLAHIPSASMTNHAPLAVGRKTAVKDAIAFDKFSTPGPLLKIYERQRRLAKEGKGHPLMIATDTVVERFELDPEDHNNRPVVLHTSRGALCFPKRATNIILAAGAFPTTTILMNSIGDRLKGRAGSRVGGHFISHITARFPVGLLGRKVALQDHLEIAASYLAGTDKKTGLQYHIQITAIHSPSPDGEDAEDAARLCPDYAAAATAAQLTGSEGHIILVCATLGELDEKNAESWMKHNPLHPDVTTNVRLQVLPNDNTNSITEVMEDATYKAISIMAGGHDGQIEYWHDAKEEKVSINHQHDRRYILAGAGWKQERPPAEMVRVPGLVHETSTLYMSDDLENDPHASVDSQYRPRQCTKVYVTGGAIFPTSGSWNPTLTMCGFAQDLADKLYEEKWGASQPGPALPASV